MKREELLARARKHLWAAWALSSEELASQAADTLMGLGMLVAEGEAAELARLRAQVAELLAERHSTNEALDDAVQELRARQTPAMPKPGVTGPDACECCGSVPEQWCPDCAACEQGCFGGFDGNSCTHANAKWGGAR